MAQLGMAQAAQAWLRSSWQVQVPMTWLDACVEWILEEGGVESIPQAQLNQQVLDQWLLTDLRDLAHPVLPTGVSEAQKMELNGCYCVQVDSLLDISQPAYTQLQHWKGTDCTNEQVSDVTQATQRPWEAKPTRMLMLQLTDGLQSLEGMEYQPVPALSTSLRPGTKLQLQGHIACHLGVLLLKSENVRVLGGEVEELVERHSQARVLCRTLGLPEETPQVGGEPDDQDLLSSVEAVAEPQIGGRVEGSLDSGYGSSTLALNASNRSVTPQNHHPEFHEVPSWGSPTLQVIPNPRRDRPNVVEIPDEDFDDFPLDELDSVIFQEPPTPGTEMFASVVPEHVRAGCSAELTMHNSDPDPANHISLGGGTDQSRRSAATLSSDGRDCHHLESSEEMDLLSDEVERFVPTGPELPRSGPTFESTHNRVGSAFQPPGAGVKEGSAEHKQSATSVDGPPFTYLCELQTGPWPPPCVREVQLQAFIVTLLGNLRSSGGEWKIGATISDGTGYLDVDLSDNVLASLIGFSATESKNLRRDPVWRSQVDAGMLNCRQALVDMCCIMTLCFDPASSRAVVLQVDAVSERDCCDLQRRVRGRIS